MRRTTHRLAPDPASIVEARRAIAALPLDPAPMAMAKLATSELVTNSLEHAGLRRGDAIELCTAIEGGRLRVSVSDPGPGPGRRMRAGLGLKIVERASDRWGVERGEELTCWWFELDLAPPSGAGGDAQGGDGPAHGLPG